MAIEARRQRRRTGSATRDSRHCPR